MTKLKVDSTINNISKYIRDELIDPYAGMTIPIVIQNEIKEIFASEVFRKKIYKGKEYSKVFIQILRDYRIQIIEDIIEHK